MGEASSWSIEAQIDIIYSCEPLNLIITFFINNMHYSEMLGYERVLGEKKF